MNTHEAHVSLPTGNSKAENERQAFMKNKLKMNTRDKSRDIQLLNRLQHDAQSIRDTMNFTNRVINKPLQVCIKLFDIFRILIAFANFIFSAVS